MRKIRSHPGRGAWAAIAVLAGMFIAAAVYQPGQSPVLLAGAVLVVVIGWVRVRAVRLEITDSVVQVKQGRYLPERQAARGDLTAIHYFPRLISFRGPDGKPMMKVAPNWTMRQMLEVADELEVPLYDHRRWLGLRKVSTGRLVNHPHQAIRSPEDGPGPSDRP
jgi:hypothetical protein